LTLSLTAIAVVTGVVLAWVWKRFANQERIALAKRQARAQLYAMRLYADDPVLVLRAQRRLLLSIARYLAQMLRPAAVAILPLLVLFVQLENVYGHRPLAPGESAMVTAQFSGFEVPDMVGATLEGRGAVVETPGVRIPGRREVCWRVRAVSTTPGSLLLHLRGAVIAKAFQCGRGLRYPLIASIARWEGLPSIEVSCPAADLDVFGFGVDWAVWFGIVSLMTMLVLRRG
jgi:hypothetical protein